MIGLKLAVIGAGSWGTAMAGILGNKHTNVTLWVRNDSLADQINRSRVNEKYLPGAALPSTVTCTSDLDEAAREARMVVIATPSHAVRDTAASLANIISNDTIVVTAAKGLELSSLKRMSEVITESIPFIGQNIAALSGPNHAEEVSLMYPSATVVAAASRLTAEKVQDLFMLPYFRVYANPDIIGVELGGALKNIIALGAGIIEGLGLGDNTKAALMTRGLTEITRLGTAMNADPSTFAGLAGIGDLIVTCTSKHSRNRRAGVLLAQGKNMQEIENETNMVVEGIKATWAAYHLSQKHGVEMPITEQMYSILYENKQPKEALLDLMTRGKTSEIEEVVANKYDWKF